MFEFVAGDVVPPNPYLCWSLLGFAVVLLLGGLLIVAFKESSGFVGVFAGIVLLAITPMFFVDDCVIDENTIARQLSAQYDDVVVSKATSIQLRADKGWILVGGKVPLQQSEYMTVYSLDAAVKGVNVDCKFSVVDYNKATGTCRDTTGNAITPIKKATAPGRR